MTETTGHCRASIFRQNLRALLQSRWLSQREAAEQVDVPYKWMRRLCHDGVTRYDRRTQAGLERIAKHFEIDVDDLWKRDAVSSAEPRQDRSLIRWWGTKRVQASEIVTRFPKEIATYYEPFIGGGAVLYELLRSGVAVKRYRCSDICEPLIQLWNLICTDPAKVEENYRRMRSVLRSRGGDFYDEVRDRFNKTHDPCDFFFLLRTCRNGYVRFNQKGEFTVGFHHKRNGAPPDEVHALLQDWHGLLTTNDVQFLVRDFRDVRSRSRDVLYLDPPYFTPHDPPYSGRIDFNNMWKWMGRQRGSYLLSLNGFVDGEDRRVAVPEQLYNEEIQLDAGIGSLNTSGLVTVTNCLYVRCRADG